MVGPIIYVPLEVARPLGTTALRRRGVRCAVTCRRAGRGAEAQWLAACLRSGQQSASFACMLMVFICLAVVDFDSYFHAGHGGGLLVPPYIPFVSDAEVVVQSSETMDQERKGEVSSVMYTYNHRSDSGFDIHEIFVKKSRSRVLLSNIGFVFLLANVCQSFLSKERLSLSSLWSITFGILVTKCLQYKPVKKESVVIMPTFEVQLETHFWSGKVHRHFVSIGKILKPELNEGVTPVTCYWSLTLFLRDEDLKRNSC
ncbi:hypothetical protein GUJ93_ZPchr0010g11112 [Zizania palustris]|uniref:Phosphatidylinositol N-acetylglucosaminyltransferase subunit H conserved domain-containing protein n=1 Tax=Zizania palustris TaxID=103762 RepID=A0A8J6BBA6_ZIZPA|nr:hypothetical protein GUJ93_ZPchr0010g11112 [Zizania palustris]